MKSFHKMAALSRNIVPMLIAPFSARKESARAILTFDSPQDVNIRLLEIERSLDGERWHTLAGIEFVKQLPIRFIDHSPMMGENIYRLKMTDEDEKLSYSQTELLHFENIEFIRIYPNPFTTRMNVILTHWSDYRHIEIHDTSGKACSHTILPGPDVHTRTFDVGNVPPGLYIVKAVRHDGSWVTDKVLKVKSGLDMVS